MSALLPEPPHRHGAPPAGPQTAVLLCNLGTPDEPTAPGMRRYLAEFLGDPRVVEIPRLAWWLILHQDLFQNEDGVIITASQHVAVRDHRLHRLPA